MDSAHLLKKKRLLWIDMVTQLRYGSPTAPEVAPGDCQHMLEFLCAKYWPFDSPAPKPRHDTHKLILRSGTVSVIYEWLPNEEWARKERKPKSLSGHPIFFLAAGRNIYLDGRRRLNYWIRNDPDKTIDYWEIS